MKQYTLILIMCLTLFFIAGCQYTKFCTQYINGKIADSLSYQNYDANYPEDEWGQYKQDMLVMALAWDKEKGKIEVKKRYDKAVKWFETGEYGRAMQMVNDAIDIANRHNDPEGLTDAFLLKAHILEKTPTKPLNHNVAFTNHIARNVNLYQRLAKSAAEFCKDTLVIAEVLRDSADSYLRKTAFPSPEEFWKKGDCLRAYDSLCKQRFAGYHQALDLYKKKDTILYKKLLDSVVNNTWDVVSMNRLQLGTKSPERKLFALWKMSYIYTEYIRHNNDFQYEMAHNRSMIDSIQKIHKVAYPLAEKLADRNKQLQLMWRYIKTLQWQGNREKAFVENRTYASLCDDSLYWANQIYAELYGAKYRLDSNVVFLDSANLYFEKALSQIQAYKFPQRDSIQEITLLDSMLQYWNCEQAMKYGKRLLLLKEKKYGIVYCYHVLMGLGDCEAKNGNFELAQEYVLKAVNIHSYANYNNFNDTDRSNSTPKFFCPYIERETNLKKHKDAYFYIPKKITNKSMVYVYRDMLPKSNPLLLDNWYCSTVNGQMPITHPDFINSKWIREAEHLWALCELSMVREKDTTLWLSALFNLTDIHGNLYQYDNKKTKDSIIFYFKETERLCKLRGDIALWVKLKDVFPSELKTDANYLNYEYERLTLEPDYKINCANYSPEEKQKKKDAMQEDFYFDKLRVMMNLNKPDSAIFYINKFKSPYIFSSYLYEITSLLIEKNMDSLAYNTLMSAHIDTLTKERYWEQREFEAGKIELLHKIYSKWGNLDSSNKYLNMFIKNNYVSRSESVSDSNDMPFIYKFMYKREPFLFELYQKHESQQRKLDIGRSIVNYADYRLNKALVAYDTLAAFYIAYHAMVVACDYQWWEEAAKYMDIARSFVEKAEDINLQAYFYAGEGNYEDWYYQSLNPQPKPSYVLGESSGIKNVPKYSNIHPEWVTPEMRLDEYAGLAYFNMADIYFLKTINGGVHSSSPFCTYIVRAFQIAERTHNRKAMVTAAIALNYYGAGIEFEENMEREYLDKCLNWIDEIDDINLRSEYAMCRFLDYSNKDEIEKAVNSWDKHSYLDTLDRFNKDEKKNQFFSHLNENDTKHYVSVYPAITNQKMLDSLLLLNWHTVLNYYDFEHRGYNKNWIEMAITNVFDKYKEMLQGKNKALETALKNTQISENQAIFAMDAEIKQHLIAEQKTSEVAQKNTQLAQANGLIKAKSDSVNLKNTIIETNNQRLDSQKTELLISKDSLEKANQKVTAQVVEVTNLKDHAIDREKITNTYMQVALAAASLFLIAFFAALAFYRKSEKEKRQVEAQKAEITKNRNFILLQQKDLNHSLGGYFNRLTYYISEMKAEGGEQVQNFGDLIEAFIRQIRNIRECLYSFSEQGVSLNTVPDYISKIVEEVPKIHRIAINPILEIQKDVELSIENATALGLIIHEALTNACKYAFKSVENPTFQVLLKRDGEAYFLKIQDNGKCLSKTQHGTAGQGRHIMDKGAMQLFGTITYPQVSEGMCLEMVFYPQNKTSNY